MEPDAVALERKIIGVRIRAARARDHRTLRQVAQRMGVSQARLRQYEMGTRDISLPELENLACIFQVPVSYFLTDETLAPCEPPTPPSEEEARTRRALIATELKKARLDAHKSEEECPQVLGRTVAQQKRYESGRTEIPITELERLARFLNVGMNWFLREEPARRESGEVLDLELWSRLPLELRTFITDPNCLPFLRIAAKIRDLPPSQLQELGEILLVVR